MSGDPDTIFLLSWVAKLEMSHTMFQSYKNKSYSGHCHGGIQQKEMNNWIGPTVKQLWNFAMHVLHNFLCLT